ncbi:MAG: EAL domain-containing protein [Gammaproteobacteria bacterium]|nr:EAL domain-containing protein [Gammaproteobacteria bacterium]
MELNTIPFHPKLPARIAGIVFWVLVLISLIIAIHFINKAENEIYVKRETNTFLLAHDIDVLIDKVGGIYSEHKRIEQRINYFREIMGFNSAIISERDYQLEFGKSNSDDDVFEYYVGQKNGAGIVDPLKVKVYFTNKEKTVAEIRKNMLLSIGIGIFVFGLFLRQLLHIMLTRPFIMMLESAKKFTLGDEAIRFNESRQDEFGYLGRFINYAIESVLEQQEDLVKALDRSEKYEAALSVEKELAEVTLNSITDSVITIGLDGNVKSINPAAEKLLDSTAEELIGKSFYEVIDIVDDVSELLITNPIKECLKKGGVIKFPEQITLRNKKSTSTAVEASVASMENESGDLLGVVVVIQDVSHARTLTRQLSYQASHDALTGLYNRRKFETHLKETLSSVKNENRTHVFLYLDLDQFKVVNDTCGHIAGDELLQQLPMLFHDVLRTGDIVARLGGDEFGVLLENCSLEKSILIADKVRENIKDFRFVWGDKTFEIGVSIGVVEINSENSDMASILSSADIACYAAKDAGRNRVHVYEESDAAVSKRHGEMHWTSRITQAMAENRLCLYYQNIINVENNSVEHVEVLLRMIGEDGSIILPGAFLPAAERFNLMSSIDRWVIANIFELMGTCKSDHPDAVMNVVAINLSGDSLNDPGLFDFIFSEKERWKVPLDHVCFEITETVAISNLSQAVIFINKLKQYGCMFSLDDFGSGLSSFTYLKSLPVNFLKIDGSFVRDISEDEIDRAMVKSIQQVAEAMSLMTIAEWVEDEQTLDILKDLGVNCVQGNYLMAAEPISCLNIKLNKEPANL